MIRKRTLISLILTGVMILTASGLASAADSWKYYFPITVSDNTGATRTAYPIILEVGGQSLVDGGYLTANGTDARLRTTADKNLLMSSDNIAFVVDSLSAYGQVTYNLYTGYSPEKSDYQVIVGDGGYITAADEASIELSDNFTVEQSGWVDTTSGEAKLLIDKTGAFGTVVSGTGNITSLVKGDAWVQKAPQLGAEIKIYSLAVHNGKLYGGTGDLTGELYEWNDVNLWVQRAPQLGAETRINALAVYNGKLYGGTNVNGQLLEWNDVGLWVLKAPKLGAETGIQSLAVYNGKLYGGGSTQGVLYEWNGVNAWVEVAPQLGAETAVQSLVTYNGKLYGASGINGQLLEWNDVDLWVLKAPKLGAETDIFSLTAYNGKLYGGTASKGNLYEWNGVDAWVSVAPQLGAEITIYSLAEYNGKLYGGTGALTGELYEWDSVSVTATGVSSGEHTVTTRQTVNLLATNPDFEDGGTPPTGWTLAGAGAASDTDTATKRINASSANLTRNGADAKLTQNIGDPTSYRGQKVTLGVWAYATVAGRIRARIFDDGGSEWTDYHPGDSTWHWLTATRTVDAATNNLYVTLYTLAGDTTGWFDAAIVVAGSDFEDFEGNKLSNWSFELGNPPDDWVLGGAGAAVVRSATEIKIDSYSAKLTRAGADCQIKYLVPEFANYANDTVTLGVWIWADVANRGRILISDGGGSDTNSAYHSGNSEWQWITITHTVTAVPVRLGAYAQVQNGATSVYFDGAIFVEGTTTPLDVTKRIDHLQILIDDVWQDSAGAATVPNTSANWTFLQNNVMPYADNITIWVGETKELWFEPNEMITGTTLPDRATSVANDGTITWGSNDGVEIVFGSVTSYEATTSVASVNVTGFVLPLVGIPDNWWGMEFDGEDLPFYPTFFDTSTQTGIPLQTLYLLVVFGAAIALATVTIVMTRSVVVGVAFYTIVMAYGANAGIVAWWIIYVFLIMVIGIIFLSSRQAMGG